MAADAEHLFPRSMSSRIVAVVLIVLSQACAASPAPEDAYAAGVQAYRAKNYALARERWEQVVSSAAGNPSAENNLGYLLYYGLGGPADRARAIRLWSIASKAGHAEAQWHLGTAFQDGIAVAQSNVEALAWYRCSIANAKRRMEIGDKALEQTIADDAQQSLDKLRSKLTDAELRKGEAIAAACIAEQQPHRRGT